MALSTTVAPDFKKYRTGIAALDSLPEEDREHGLNAGSYKTLNVNVIPTDDAEPTVAVLFWSPEASAFVAAVPALAFVAPAPNVPFSFSFDANGRIVFLAVTAGATGNVEIETSGYDMDHSL